MKNIVIVVPVFNEAGCIGELIDSMACQTDMAFTIVFVDNGSKDNTAQIIARDATLKKLRFEIINEPQKGTGSASDTGFNFAIKELKADIIARTDADCILDKNWVRVIRDSFEDNTLEFLVGRIVPKNERGITFYDRVLSASMVRIAWFFGIIKRRGSDFKYPYILVAGNNLAIKPELYRRAGGFPRTAIDDTNEDTVLAEHIRTLTTHVLYEKKMVVANSLRRFKKYGPIKTLLWYKDRSYKPAKQNEIDIR